MIKFVRWIFPLSLVPALLGQGCAQPPAGALVLNKPSVDFGASMLNDTISVSSPFGGAKVAVRAEWDCSWLDVSPPHAFTMGPENPATLKLSVTRAHMKPGGNTCEVVIKADGFDDLPLLVRADAILSADFHSSRNEASVGERVTFSDETRVITGAEPIVSWKWDFGDGESSAEQNPVHTYSAPGAYTVSLSVRSPSGADVRIRANCVRVTVPSIPDADFVASSQKPVKDMPVEFRDTSTPGVSPILGWLWDFGDGGWSAEQNPVHIFTAAAVYDVYLSVRNVTGTDTAVKLGYIDVQAASP